MIFFAINVNILFIYSYAQHMWWCLYASFKLDDEILNIKTFPSPTSLHLLTWANWFPLTIDKLMINESNVWISFWSYLLPTNNDPSPFDCHFHLCVQQLMNIFWKFNISCYLSLVVSKINIAFSLVALVVSKLFIFASSIIIHYVLCLVV